MRIVLTGLDGSLLDAQTNSYGAARQALSALERRSIPLIPVSRRTRAQLEEIRQQLHLEHPFISEDGSALYLPEHYFPESILDRSWRHQPPYYAQILGLPYTRLRQILQVVREQYQLDLVAFGDWTVEELAVALGIPVAMAHLAQNREYSEIFRYSGDLDRLQQALAQQEQTLEGYRLQLQPLSPFPQLNQWYLTGKSIPAKMAMTTEVDPGAVAGEEATSRRWGGQMQGAQTAVHILLECYQRHLGSVVALGIGSRPADVAWLKLTDSRVVLPSLHLNQVWSEAGENWHLAELPGPEGWNEAVLMWLEETDHGDE
jgi:predicted mannosyl-3-phosphoglycerate phosphatase (HAD superfamily)